MYIYEKPQLQALLRGIMVQDTWWIHCNFIGLKLSYRRHNVVRPNPNHNATIIPILHLHNAYNVKIAKNCANTIAKKPNPNPSPSHD